MAEVYDSYAFAALLLPPLSKAPTIEALEARDAVTTGVATAAANGADGIAGDNAVGVAAGVTAAGGAGCAAAVAATGVAPAAYISSTACRHNSRPALQLLERRIVRAMCARSSASACAALSSKNSRARSVSCLCFSLL